MWLIILLVRNEGTTENMMLGSKYTKSDKSEDSAPKKRGGPKFTEYARLNTSQSQIIIEIEKDKDVRWPKTVENGRRKKEPDTYTVGSTKIMATILMIVGSSKYEI